jgi:hypothetical protein
VLASVDMRIRAPDELELEALRTSQEEGPRVVPFLFSRNGDPGACDPIAEPGPLAHTNRDVVDAGRCFALLRVVEPEDLVAEEQERVVRPFADDVHAELLDEESTRLVAVPNAYVDMVESDQSKVPWRRSGGHDRHSPTKPYILSGTRARRRAAGSWVIRPPTGFLIWPVD